MPQRSLLQDVSKNLVAPLELTGLLLQFMLNHRARTFAGRYKSAVVVHIILQALILLNFVPALLGRIDTRIGISVENVVYMLIWMAMAWQALTLPNVPQAGGDEDDE
jgi:hypothetical protein